MTRTLHSCPQCGGITSNSGPCDTCLAKQEREDRLQKSRSQLGWLYLAWQARKPLFFLVMALCVLYSSTILTWQGSIAANFWHVGKAVPQLLFLLLMLASGYALLTEPRWTRAINRRTDNPRRWFLTNLALSVWSFVLGLPLVIGGVYLAQTQLPKDAQLSSGSGGLWVYNRIALLIMPLMFALMFWGSLHPN